MLSYGAALQRRIGLFNRSILSSGDLSSVTDDGTRQPLLAGEPSAATAHNERHMSLESNGANSARTSSGFQSSINSNSIYESEEPTSTPTSVVDRQSRAIMKYASDLSISKEASIQDSAYTSHLRQSVVRNLAVIARINLVLTTCTIAFLLRVSSVVYTYIYMYILYIHPVTFFLILDKQYAPAFNLCLVIVLFSFLSGGAALYCRSW